MQGVTRERRNKRARGATSNAGHGFARRGRRRYAATARKSAAAMAACPVSAVRLFFLDEVF